MKTLHDFRLLPALFLLDGTDARQTAARALTNIDQVEHLNERLISRVGYAADKGLLHIDAERARIGDANFIRPFLNHQTAPIIVVGMKQGGCQSLAQSLMQRGVVNAICAFQLKRRFNILRNPAAVGRSFPSVSRALENCGKDAPFGAGKKHFQGAKREQQTV